MPTYEYRCESCEKKMEVSQKITDEPLKDCPSCGKESLRRGPGGGIGLQFRGSGFYITDYKNVQKESVEQTSATAASDSSCCPCGKDKPSCSS